MRPWLSPDEEAELVLRAQAGDHAASDALVLAHRPIALRWARIYGRSKGDRDDLVSAGMLALCECVPRYRRDLGASFGGMAGPWVRAAVRACAVRATAAPRPQSRAARRLYCVLPGIERALALAGLRATDAAVAHTANVSATSVREFRAAALPPLDADSPTGTLRELTEDSTPELLLIAAERRRAEGALVAASLACLCARERGVVVGRALSETPKTLRELGLGMGVSKERARQIEAAALAKIAARIRELAPEGV